MIRLVTWLLILIPPSSFAGDEQLMLDESRIAVKNFGSRLKGELQKGLEKGGPEAAIQICHNVAKEIADSISQQYGWKIGRTSLKVRNPRNAPDSWEKQVLEEFEKRKNKSEDITNMEYFETIQADGKEIFRYMKAIPTSGLCLNCHGQEISAKVVSQLNALYPQDRARGFKAGDIRGAFTITRPILNQSP